MPLPVSSTVFTPIPNPIQDISKKQLIKEKYLDKLFTKEWVDKYFSNTSIQ